MPVVMGIFEPVNPDELLVLVFKIVRVRLDK